jgi:hypothetical protein
MELLLIYISTGAEVENKYQIATVKQTIYQKWTSMLNWFILFDFA